MECPWNAHGMPIECNVACCWHSPARAAITGNRLLSLNLFSSPRERRLWALTQALVIAIFATLGIAGTLADAFRDTGLDVVFFFLGMFLVGGAVLAWGLRARPGGVEIGVALGIIAVYFMAFARTTFAERSHLIEYGVVASCMYAALTERSNGGRPAPMPAVIAVSATALVGAVDEGVQKLIPSRIFDPLDILFNTLAGMTAVSALVALGLARRWAASHQESRL